MPQGLQVWNAAGTLIIDTSTPTGVILGIHSFPGGNAGTGGSIVVPALALGTPWTVLRGSFDTDPTVSVSGTTITWLFPVFAFAAVTYQLIYGYF